jgi:hypothetical protein
MSNEFEKQVRQKMEELKLVPSEPVWQKVEMQIRKKKDRRRLLLWIPFLVLLLSGGLWIGIDHYSNQVAYNKNNSKTEKNSNKTVDLNSPTTPPTTTAPKDLNKKSSESIRTTKNNSTLQSRKIKLVTEPKDVSVGLSNAANVQNNVSKKIGEATEKSKKKNAVKPEETEVNNPAVDEAVVTPSSIEKILKEAVPNLAIQLRTDTANGIFLKKKIEPSISIAGFIKKDSASVKDSIQKQNTVAVKKADLKKYAGSKWKYNLFVASGLSGLSRLNFFNGQKSMGALYANSPGSTTGPGIIYYGPSSVKKGLSFSVGGATQKQLSKRLVFSAGLQYNYYSNSIRVGNVTRRDTVFRGAYSVTQFYSNNRATYSYFDTLGPYHNHYHFISLPLTVDWQVFKKLPLNFHTGFSVQQVIQTNALIFDYSSQAYYHSNKAFNKTLLFTEYGLNYSIAFNKTYLTLGPQLQYGLTSLEKNNSTYHLFSYGLRAQLQLNKK